MDTVKLDEMTQEEACEVLDDMKVKIDIPHAAVMQRKRNEALDMGISALSAIEKIRAEIIQDVQNGVIQITKGSDRLFEIIDKHVGGKTNE